MAKVVDKKPKASTTEDPVHGIKHWLEALLLLIVWIMLTYTIVVAWKSPDKFQKVTAMVYAKKLFALDEDMCNPDAPKNGACLTVLYGTKPEKAFLRVRDDPKLFALKNDIVIYVNKDKPTKAYTEYDIDRYMKNLKWMLALWTVIDLLVLVLLACKIMCLFRH